MSKLNDKNDQFVLNDVQDDAVVSYTKAEIGAAEELFDMGADGFLVKSEITPDKIAGEIQTVLQKYA